MVVNLVVVNLIRVLGAGAAIAGLATAQEHVSFATQDGGLVHADLYGKGNRGLVLAHGGRFNKESWQKQARVFEAAGFRVLAIDLRGYGLSQGPGQSDPLSAPLQLDVLAAVSYLRKTGARTVSVVGGSMGGAAAGDASIASESGQIDRLVFLGAAPNGPAEETPLSHIVHRDTSRLQRGWTETPKNPSPIQ